MQEQFWAIITIGFLLIFWFALNRVGDKGERIFFSILFSLTIVGVFVGGVLQWY